MKQILRVFLFTQIKILLLLIISSSLLAEEEKTEKVVKSLSFDSKTAMVSYELTHPAKVRIRIGTKEGPLLRTLVDWQERGIGSHQEAWDGLDLTGGVKLVNTRDLVFTFNYFTEDDTFLKNISTEDILPHPEQLRVGRFLPSLDINRIHKSHSRGICSDPELKISLPKDVAKTQEGYIIIKEKMPITIDISDKDKVWFGRERYTIQVFIDDVFLAGELEGYSPYNFIFEPKNINKGRHLITVNYSGFADHIGIASIPIHLEKTGSDEGARVAQAQ